MEHISEVETEVVSEDETTEVSEVETEVVSEDETTEVSEDETEVSKDDSDDDITKFELVGASLSDDSKHVHVLQCFFDVPDGSPMSSSRTSTCFSPMWTLMCLVSLSLLLNPFP